MSSTPKVALAVQKAIKPNQQIKVSADGHVFSDVFVLEPYRDTAAREALWMYAMNAENKVIGKNLQDWLEELPFTLGFQMWMETTPRDRRERGDVFLSTGGRFFKVLQEQVIAVEKVVIHYRYLVELVALPLCEPWKANAYLKEVVTHA